VKPASAQASRPFTHARYAPPTNCHPQTRLSCNRARPFPRESRSDHRLSTDDFPTRCACAFPNRPEEPAFSRRRPRFGGSVQSATGSSPTVTRCEPTSDVPVAAATSIRTPHCLAVKPLSELVRIWSRQPSLHPPTFREENRLRANQDIFHRQVPFLDPELFSSVPRCGCQQEPPPTTSRHDLAFEYPCGCACDP
jgi:hypothetical protein